MSTTVAPDDPAITYSPFTWSVGAAAATTINAGAYLSLLFTGDAISLSFDVAGLGFPAPEIYHRIDGHDAGGTWTRAQVAATVTPAMPGDTAAAPLHLLELCVKSTSETLTRWSTASQTAVALTGIVLAPGARVRAPGCSTLNVLFLGDSLTEGVRTMNETAPDDTGRNDATMGWAYAQRRLLGCEVGIVGFGASGLTVGGSGGVPPLLRTFDLILPGAPRSFTTPAPDLVVLNHGTNDGGAPSAAVTLALREVLDGLLAAIPANTRIAVLRPFNGTHAAALRAGVAAAASPRVTFVDTAGFLDPAAGIDGIALHPLGPNNVGLIAPMVAAALRPLLQVTPAAPQPPLPS